MNDVDALVSEPTRSAWNGPAQGAALSLSGGGFRAMLFHTGTLWRLGELGFFSDKPLVRVAPGTGEATNVGNLERVSSVSGGSIVSAVLALAIPRLETLEGPEFVAAFNDAVVDPVRRLAGLNLAGTSVKGILAVLKDVFAPGSVNDHVAAAYDAHLYHGKTLQDLPDRIRFIFNASNLQSGALWRFSKPYMRDWRVGEVKNPTLPLATAVGASSAFPPVLAPATLNLSSAQFTPSSGDGRDANGSLQRAPFTTSPSLADGGVYDNLGLETCFKRYKTLFVSNAGKPFEFRGKISRNWASIGARCLDVMDNQVLSQRKIALMNALESSQRTGAFWDIQQDIQKHHCPGRLPCPPERTALLARIGTDLAAKSNLLQEQLINWGYASADAAIRAWFNQTYPPPTGFPYPQSAV
jgi:NTE family protein